MKRSVVLMGLAAMIVGSWMASAASVAAARSPAWQSHGRSAIQAFVMPGESAVPVAMPPSRRLVDGHRARRANIADPTKLGVDFADWNGSIQWSFFDTSGLDNPGIGFDQFHRTTYASSGVIGNGECGVDRNGDPYPFVCSAFGQSELIAIQPEHLIYASYIGSLYKSGAKAAARYQDALGANKNGVSCKSPAVSNCRSWLYQFVNNQKKVTAFGVFSALQEGNFLGESLTLITPGDYGAGKGTRAQTFFADTGDLIGLTIDVALAGTKRGSTTVSNPLLAAAPFSVWPGEAVTAARTLKPSDADKGSVNPVRGRHSKSYTSAGMLATGSCGTSDGNPLPKKCGGVLQEQIDPLGSSAAHTDAITYLGTLYPTAGKALAHFNDSDAARGSGCGLNYRGAVVAGCKISFGTAGGGSAKIGLVYGAVPVGNTLIEVQVSASFGDYSNGANRRAMIGGLFSVITGALDTVHSA